MANQNGTKGIMTLINRSSLSIYCTYAMEGINEIYPAPGSDPSGIKETSADSRQSSAIYNLQGMKVADSSHQADLCNGIYVTNGRKYVKGRTRQ